MGMHADRALGYLYSISEDGHFKLTEVYANKGDLPRAQLASAEQQVLNGHFTESLRSAETAESGLPRGSPDWLRAQDIAMEARTAIARAQKRK